jgi:hypothetical protein
VRYHLGPYCRKILSMQRRFCAWWIPVLAVLLAGPMLQPLPGWSRAVPLGRTEISGAAVEAVLPSARLQPGLHVRSSPPLERQGTRFAGALGGDEPVEIAFAPVIVHPIDHSHTLPADSARHFPLFPTGPPSQG